VRIHQRRWRTLVDWQREILAEASHSTWMTLKRAVPVGRTF
jgi:hypothetical protein